MTIDDLVRATLGAQQLEILTLRAQLAMSQAKVQEVSAQLAKQLVTSKKESKKET